MKKILTILITILSLYTSCQNSEKTSLYTMTPEIAKTIDLPEIHFSIEIPENLTAIPPKVGQKNYSYQKVEKYDGKAITQMSSIGYIKLKNVNDQESAFLSFLGQVKSLYASAGFEFEENELKVTKFDGKEYPIFQGIGSLKDNTNAQYQGRYFFKAVALKNPKLDTHALIIMMARDDQGIKNHEDFKDKLAISKIWKSFKFIDS